MGSESQASCAGGAAASQGEGEAPTQKAEPSVIFGHDRTFLAKYAEPERPQRGGEAAAGSTAPDRANVHLNTLLVRAGTAERVLEVVGGSFLRFNAVNVITALHRLASLVPAHKKLPVRRNWRCKCLVERLGDLLRIADAAALQPRDLSNAAWALMKLGFFSETLFSQLKKYILLSIEAFKPVNISMMLWSFSRVGFLDHGLCQASAREAKRQLSDFQPRQIADVIWALANANFVDEELFFQAADVALHRPDAFDLLNSSKLLYAFALVKLPHPRLFQEVARRCTAPAVAASACMPDVVTNLALAFAEEGALKAQVFEVVTQVAGEGLSCFKPPQLATLAGAFARAGRGHEAFLGRLSHAVAARQSEFRERELEKLGAAFQSLGLSAVGVGEAEGTWRTLKQEGAAKRLALPTLALGALLMALLWHLQLV